MKQTTIGMCPLLFTLGQQILLLITMLFDYSILPAPALI